MLGEEKPALRVYAPLSMMRVRAGGTGPEDFVLLWAGAMVHM